MEAIIKKYFKENRSFNTGVDLYVKYGNNMSFKTVLNRQGYTDINKQLLFEELRKLAGIKQEEFQFILSKPVEKEVIIETVTEPAGDGNVGSETPPETIPMNAITGWKIRTEFPFLSKPDCPNELKVLVADMFTSHDNYVESHAKLFETKTEDEVFAAASDTVENYLNNQAIWKELNYYKETGKVLGEHPIFSENARIKEIQAMTTAEHVKLKKSLENNIARTKKTMADNPDHKNNGDRSERVGKMEVELKEVNRLLGINE